MNQLTNQQGLTEAEFLAQYNPNQYPKPSVTVDILLFTVSEKAEENTRKLPEKELQVLLIKRGDHPFIGQWALPGGFVNIGEDLDTAAERELKEETNIDHAYMEQLYTLGAVNRDPRARIISVAHMALVDRKKLNVLAGSDAREADWFTVRHEIKRVGKINTENGYIIEKFIKLTLTNGEEQPYATIKVTKNRIGTAVKVTREIIPEESQGLAFDHAKVIDQGIERLQNKVEYTDIAFNLMPERFTLTELQQVYEIILGKELLLPAFRKKIAHMVIETNETKKQGANRPAKYYRFNPSWEDEGI